MKSKKATSKPVPFTISGYPVDLIDQEQLRELKAIADRQGITVEEAIDDAFRLYVAKSLASLDPGDKIVRFPKRRSRRARMVGIKRAQ